MDKLDTWSSVYIVLLKYKYYAHKMNVKLKSKR